MKNKALIDLLNKIGHNIKYREYTRPGGIYPILYITEIDGKRYRTDEQYAAHRALEKLMEAENGN